MKRFWVFRYDEYYPSGGMMDLLTVADTLDEARAAAFSPPRENGFSDLESMHAHIFDAEREAVVWRSFDDPDWP